MKTLVAAWLAVLLTALVAAVAWSAVPETIGYQGLLTDDAGAPIADGTYALTFRLYRQDGTLIYEETQSLPVAAGRVSARIGAMYGLYPEYFTVPLLLGVQVGAEPELVPRIPLDAAPYSQVARYSEVAGALSMGSIERYLSVSAEEFTPGSHTVSYSRNTLRVSSSSTGTTMATGLHLPHGARITRWQALFDDTDPAREVSLALRRTNVATGAFQQLALLASGVAHAAGLTLQVGTSFADDVIDNTNWAYSLQAYWGSGGGAAVALAAVQVTYIVTEPLP